MSTGNITIVPRVNFYDGQNLYESDLDQEQAHLRSLSSGHVAITHGSGVIKENIIDNRFLLKIKNPGYYGDNNSKFIIDSGQFDGRPISLDRQVSNSEFGKRLIFELKNVNVLLNKSVKVLILGVTYNALDTRGELVTELLEFTSSDLKITKNSYKYIYAIYLNNFSGGVGSNSYEELISYNYYENNENIDLQIYESDSIKVFQNTISIESIDSPSYYLDNFITYSTSLNILDILEEALDSTFSISELFYQKDESYLLFSAGDNSSTSFGQKFLAKTKTIQKISLLVSIDTDVSNVFSGNIILSVHKLNTSINNYMDVYPDNLINFDPEISPIAEISYSYDDLLSMGIKLSSIPVVLDFDFSSTLIANPNLDPSLEVDSYYCFLIKRVGDTSDGTVRIHYGNDRQTNKVLNNQSLNIKETYDKKQTILVEFDKINNKFVDNSDKSLWFKIHASLVEISSGFAVSEDGHSFEIPSFIEYIGNNLIQFNLDNLELRFLNGEPNYIILDRAEKFSKPVAHPRTGNYTFTRISDSYEISILSADELESILDLNPNILSAVYDINDRSPSDITGSFSSIGQISTNKIYFINPPQNLLNKSNIGKIFIPDNDCDCGSKYIIESINCKIMKSGDLNNDGRLTSADLISVLNLSGSNINSTATQLDILKGNISYLDFYKSDLNNDGFIDGLDVFLLENAISGNIDFSKPEKFTFVEIELSNIDYENNFPVIFLDNTNSGITTSGTNTFSMTVDLPATKITRPGDFVVIPVDSIDAGKYVIDEITYSGLTSTMLLLNEDGTTPSFSGSSSFNASIVSKTSVNIYADNKAIVSLPYSNKNWVITSSINNYKSDLIKSIDLRRFVEQSYLNTKNTEDCICIEDSCESIIQNNNIILNDKVIPNNLYIPNGDILSAPGIPHHGDFEFSSIKIPLPSGDVSGCSIDIYSSFIKSYNGGCNTISGYPAMKFSDGTLVGCNDTESSSDLSNGRVKFSSSISSIYIDNYNDGYIGGEELEVSKVLDADTIILSSSTKEEYASGFDGIWTEVSTTLNSMINYGTNYASLELDASSSSVTTSTTMGRPLSAADLSGDFTILFTANRDSWDPSKIAIGEVKFYSKMVIQNSYGGESTIKFGWKQSGTDDSVKLFYSGTITDGMSEIYNFDFSIDTPELDGSDLEFKIERINDALNIFYYNKNTLLVSDAQKYIRLGENISYLIGDGLATFEFIMESTSLGVHSSYLYKVKIFSDNFTINYNQLLNNVSSNNEILIGKVDGLLNELFFNFPLDLKSGTSILSANIIFTASQSFSITSTNFKVVPYYGFNSKNISKYIDIVREKDPTLHSSISPASGAANDEISIDITNFISYILSSESHISGYYKGLLITSLGSETESFSILNNIKIDIVYYEIASNSIIKIGLSIDPSTGILKIDSKNVLFNNITEEQRTYINIGVYLKKSGFKNSDISVNINDLSRLWIGTCP